MLIIENRPGAGQAIGCREAGFQSQRKKRQKVPRTPSQRPSCRQKNPLTRASFSRTSRKSLVTRECVVGQPGQIWALGNQDWNSLNPCRKVGKSDMLESPQAPKITPWQ